MGRLLLIMLVSAAAIVLGGIALLAWYDGERIAERLAATLYDDHGVSLEIEQLQRTMEWRPVVNVTGLRVANARRSKAALIEVEKARFRVRLASLVFGPLTLDDVEVSGVRLVIPYDREGVRYWEPVVDALSTWLHRFDWSVGGFDIENLSLARRPADSGPELLVSAELVAGAMPTLSDLTVAARGVDANLETTLPLRLQGTARLETVTLDRRSGDLPMSLTASGRVEDRPLAIDFRGGNLLSGDPMERDPVEGSIRLGDHEARVSGTMSRDDDRHVDVAVDMDIRDDDEQEPLRGRLRLSDPGDGWHFGDIALRRDAATLEGDVAVTRTDSRRHVDVDLDVQGVDYPFHEQKDDEPVGEADGQDESDDLYGGLLEFIDRFDAAIAVRVNDSSFFGVPLEDVVTRTSVNHGTFETLVDRGSVLGGGFGGSLTVVPDAESATVTFTAALRNGDVARLLAGIPALDGSLGDFDGDARLSAAGRRTADVLSSIEGRASLYVDQGAIPDEMATWMAGNVITAMFADFDRDDRTPVDCAVIEFAVRDGLARSRRMVLDTGSFTLVGEGEISLPASRLRIDLAPHAKRFSLLSLRLPVRIAGPFDAIEVDTDKSEAAASLLTPIDTGGGADVTCSAPMTQSAAD